MIFLGTSSTDTDPKTVRMYATDTELCPVGSFKMYLAKRNLECSALFQTPRNTFDTEDPVWYEKRPLGKNRLGTMMAEFSRQAKLSKSYTNHCIRATAITALDQAGFEARHIATVSGHRNEASIRSYSRDTSTAQKRKISATLSSLIPTCSGPSIVPMLLSEKQNDENKENTDINADDSVETSGENMLNDNDDEILYLSASQSEIVMQEIKDMENQDQCQTSTVTRKEEYQVHEVRTRKQIRRPPPSLVFNAPCTVNLYYQN